MADTGTRATTALNTCVRTNALQFSKMMQKFTNVPKHMQMNKYIFTNLRKHVQGLLNVLHKGSAATQRKPGDTQK